MTICCRSCNHEELRRKAQKKRDAEEAAKSEAVQETKPEPKIQWHIFTEAQVMDICRKAILGTGRAMSTEELAKVISAIIESTVGSCLGELLLRDEIGITFQDGEPKWTKKANL